MRGGGSQLVTNVAIEAGGSHEDENGETYRGANTGAGGGNAGGDALFPVGHSGCSGDEHRGEYHAVADAERHQAWDEGDIRAVG
jgi:hypothetical protein